MRTYIYTYTTLSRKGVALCRDLVFANIIRTYTFTHSKINGFHNTNFEIIKQIFLIFTH